MFVVLFFLSPRCVCICDRLGGVTDRLSSEVQIERKEKENEWTNEDKNIFLDNLISMLLIQCEKISISIKSSTDSRMRGYKVFWNDVIFYFFILLSIFFLSLLLH